MWFCSSGLGPRQQRLKSAAPAVWNVLVGPKARKKKNADTANSTTIAQPTSASSRRRRYLRITAAM